MKTFVFQKSLEYQDDDKWEIQEKYNAVALDIKQKKYFNCIVMKNPAGSNCICVINNININLRENNRLFISIGEKLKEEDLKEKRGNINICCGYNADKGYEDTAMDIINSGKKFDVLCKQYVILIPGGSLYIKLQRAVREVKINMDWREEEI